MATVLEYIAGSNSLSVTENGVTANVAGTGIDNAFTAPQTFNGTINQAPGAGANNQGPFLQASDMVSDYIVSGINPTVPSPASLTMTIPAGTAFVLGQRTLLQAAVADIYPASSDTYFSMTNTGVGAFASVANGAAAPAAPANAINLLKVVTSPIVSPVPTLTTSSSGSLASGTYLGALVAHDATGYGAVSATASVTVAASGTMIFNWVNPLNETAMDIYATTAGSNTLGLVASGVTGTTYTYTGSVAPGAAAPTVATSNAIQATNYVTPLRIETSQIARTPQMYGAVADGVTDCTTAFQCALDAAGISGPGIVFVPAGNYYFSGVLTVPPGVSLIGASVGNAGFSAFPSGTENNQTTVFFITNNQSPFCTLTQSSTVANFVGYYPNQVLPTASAPIFYPPMVTVPLGSMGGCNMNNIGAINAYIGINVSAGRCTIHGCSVAAYAHPYRVDGAEDYVIASDNMTGPYWDIGSAYPYPQAIDTWVMANQSALTIGRADGILVSNFGAFSTGIGVGLVDSVYNLTTRGGYGKLTNIDIDTCSTGVYCSSSNTIGYGYKIVNMDIGASSTGSTPIYLPSGGSAAPMVSWYGGSIRGTWSNGDSLVNAGTLEMYNIQGNPATTLALLNQSQSSGLVVSHNGAAGDITVTAAEIVGGYFSDGATQTAAFTVTTDTAANILAAMPNAVVGTAFKWRFINYDQSATGYAGTLAGGTGVTVGTILPNPAVPKGGYEDYVFTFTAIGATPALSVEAVGGSSAALL